MTTCEPCRIVHADNLRLYAALSEISELDMEGAASLADAIAIADDAISPTLLTWSPECDAPQLLAALKFVMAFYEPDSVQYLDTEAWKVAHTQARTAITKAEGGTT